MGKVILWIQSLYSQILSFGKVNKTLYRKKYADELFRQIEDEYKLLKLSGKPQHLNSEQYKTVIEAIDHILDRHPASLNVCRRMLPYLITLMNDTMLSHKMHEYIDEYKTYLEGHENPNLIVFFSDKENLKKPKQLRERLIQIVKLTNEYLLARAERLRQKTIFGTINIFILLGAGGLIYVITANSNNTNTFNGLIAILAGVMGGVLSTQQRIIGSDIPVFLWVRGFRGVLAKLNVLISPLFGGIGALAIFILLQTNIVALLFNPEVIPAFIDHAQGERNDFFSPVVGTTYDAALLFIICFISGFSERLVPDVLDRLSSVITKNRNTTSDESQNKSI